MVSLFEHRSVEQLLCDIAAFFCSDCTNEIAVA